MSDKRRVTKKSPRTSARKDRESIPQSKSSGMFQDFFRIGESYTSLVLGIIVVIAVAALLVSFARNPLKAPETPSKDISATNLQVNPSLNSDLKPGSTYTVQSGDDLWNIAEKTYKNGNEWERIAKANNIKDPNLVSAGTKLMLPEVDRPAQVTTAPSPTVTPTVEPTKVAQQITTPTPALEKSMTPTGPPTEKITGTTYVVQSGDDLWDIAVRAYGDGYKWVEIARANNLQNPDIIHKGNTFTLPR